MGRPLYFMTLTCKCGGTKFTVKLGDMPANAAKHHPAVKEVKRFICDACGDYLLVFMLFSGKGWEWK
jgi:hypothetical protein